MELKPLYTRIATAKTPEVRILYDESAHQVIIRFQGRCIPENPIEFFGPLNERIKSKLRLYEGFSLRVEFDLEYINSISIKFLVKLLTFLKEFVKPEKYTVVWYYEDEDTYELGLDLSFFTGIEFDYVKKSK